MEMAHGDAQELQKKTDTDKFAYSAFTFKQNKTPQKAHKKPYYKSAKNLSQCVSVVQIITQDLSAFTATRRATYAAKIFLT